MNICGLYGYGDIVGKGGPNSVFNSKNMSLFSYAANNPLIYIDPDGNEIFVTVKGNNINVLITVEAFGKGASKEWCQKYKANVEKGLTGKFGSYNVKTTVDIQLQGSKKDESRHQIDVSDEDINARVIDRKLMETDKYSSYFTDNHETGHFLGLLDEYIGGMDARNKKGVPDDSMMGIGGKNKKFYEYHIELLRFINTEPGSE